MYGSIFIPDITGFTNFVNNVNADLGASITKDLLNEIIINNPLNLKLSEIEGDAILYYKPGKPVPIDNMFVGLKNISAAFDKKYKSLKVKYRLQADLSLKFIVHYGLIKVYTIAGLKSLYGEAVIESHCLLKNGAGLSNYILITEDYFKALNVSTSDITSHGLDYKYYCSKTFEGLRKLSYYFFNCLPGEVTENSFIRA
jgi:Protein of unknown function (DUF2652)